MNNFFKQLLGSIVQIGINELSKKKVAKQQPTPRPLVRGRGPRSGEGVKQTNPSAYGSSPQKGSQEDLKIGGKN